MEWDEEVFRMVHVESDPVVAHEEGRLAVDGLRSHLDEPRHTLLLRVFERVVQQVLENDPELAVIMLTGVNDPKLAMECIEKGARTYLVKPIHPDFLRLALLDALAMRAVLMERNRLVESD